MGGDRAACKGVRGIYRRNGLHGARLRPAFSHEQIDRAYRGNITERFVWVVE